MTKLFMALLCVAGIVVSCDTLAPKSNGPVTIDIRRSLRKTYKNADLFERVHIVGIEEPAEKRIFRSGRFTVSNGNYIFKDSLCTSLLVFNPNGEYVKEIEFSDTILDFNDYKDKYIDVLAGRRLYVYDASDFKLEVIYQLPENDVQLVSFVRRSDDVFQLSGFSQDCDYVVEYYTKENKSYFVPNPIPLPQEIRESSISKSYFFKDGDESRFFYSHSGDIWYISTFSSPRIRWRFEGIPDSSVFYFTNAQGYSGKVYLTMVLDGDTCSVIYNPDLGRSKVISRTKEKCRFPIGVIKNKINYVFCAPDQILDYIGELPDGYDASGPVILQYTLSD